jgi:hypothetical protein
MKVGIHQGNVHYRNAISDLHNTKEENDRKNSTGTRAMRAALWSSHQGHAVDLRRHMQGVVGA